MAVGVVERRRPRWSRSGTGLGDPRCSDRDRLLPAGGGEHATEKFKISAACSPRGRGGVASQNTWCEGVAVGVVERFAIGQYGAHRTSIENVVRGSCIVRLVVCLIDAARPAISGHGACVSGSWQCKVGVGCLACGHVVGTSKGQVGRCSCVCGDQITECEKCECCAEKVSRCIILRPYRNRIRSVLVL